jgi:uncharacterized protein (DUF983 family)
MLQYQNINIFILMGRLKDALRLRCPKCGQGELFAEKGFFSMSTNCSNCKLKYEKENGFFYGAMYISYGINVATFVLALIIFFIVEDKVDWRIYMSSYVLLTVLATKFLFRFSRSIWLMIMVKYEGLE